MHFTPKYAPVFFGREGLEVHDVLDRLLQPTVAFVMVSGSSGRGKSSLVHAGMLPRIEAEGLPGVGERPTSCESYATGDARFHCSREYSIYSTTCSCTVTG
jgi:hypothetical protein